MWCVGRVCAVICCFGESERKIKKKTSAGAVFRRREKRTSVSPSVCWGERRTNPSGGSAITSVSCLRRLTPFALLLPCEANTLLLCEVVCIWYIFCVCNRHFVLRRRTEVKTEIGNETGNIVWCGPVARTDIQQADPPSLPERPSFRAWAVISLWESIGTGGDTRFAQEDWCEADRGVKKRHLVVVGRRSPKYPERSTENFLIG